MVSIGEVWSQIDPRDFMVTSSMIQVPYTHKSKLKRTNIKHGRKGTHLLDDGVGKIQIVTSWLNLSKIQELQPTDVKNPYSITDLDAEPVYMTMVCSLGKEYAPISNTGYNHSSQRSTSCSSLNPSSSKPPQPSSRASISKTQNLVKIVTIFFF